MRILLTGASGSGTTTLGRALSEALDIRLFDTDDYFWLPTEPPFQQPRDDESRLAMFLGDLRAVSDAIVSGSIVGWGAQLEDSFSLIVFLTLSAEIRVPRLHARELAKLGRIDQEFLDWAAQYDEGRLPGRSRPRHERWLAERGSTPLLRLDGDLSVEQRVARVLEALAAVGDRAASSG